MKINNLVGVSGGIKVGKDLVGEMVTYIGDARTINPTFKEFEIVVNFDTTYKTKKFADKLKDCVCLILGCTRKRLEERDFKEVELGEEWWRYEKLTLNFQTHLKSVDEYEELSDNQKTHWSLVKLTPRKLLQLIGTEGGRKIIHPNMWVNALFSEYKLETKANRLFHRSELFSDDGDDLVFEDVYPNWVITDVRYPKNEGAGVTNRGGKMIGVRRKFGLRFPGFAHLISDGPYDIPKTLRLLDSELYTVLTHESESLMGDHSWCDVVIENNGTMEELFDNVLNAIK